MKPTELIALAVASGEAKLLPLKDLPKSCCHVCDCEVVDFDCVKDTLFSDPRPKSCDGLWVDDNKFVFLEMKSLFDYWENKHHEYIKHLKASGISKRELRSTQLPHDSDIWYRDRLKEKVAIDFAHPETYFDSCRVMHSLAVSVGRSEQWDSMVRQDEYIFIHDADRSVELTTVVSEDIPQLFLVLFQNVAERLDRQVQKFTPLMMTCTEFEEKYKPAQA